VEELIWKQIPDFPSYAVNNYGQVLKIDTDRLMRISYTLQGAAKVSLMGLEGRRTLSVALLVAGAFVEPPNPLSDSVVVLNGNQADLRAVNLAWRSRSFVWRYTRQMRDPLPIHYINLAVRDVTTGVVYRNIIEAGQALGLLYQDIWRSTYTGYTTYPGDSVFEVVR
jgi:hypothetical protein